MPSGCYQIFVKLNLPSLGYKVVVTFISTNYFKLFNSAFENSLKLLITIFTKIPMTLGRTQVIISFINFSRALSACSTVENFIANTCILELLRVLVLRAVFLLHCRYTVIYIVMYICICIWYMYLFENLQNELGSNYVGVLDAAEGAKNCPHMKKGSTQQKFACTI